jgi:hypothetical protein
MSRFSFAIAVLMLALGVSDVRAREKPKPNVVIEITDSDLTGGPDAWGEGFDLSPDGSQVAVAFRTDPNREQSSISVGVWDISTKRVLARREVEGLMPIKGLLHAGLTREVRYTPAGDKLVVQTGPHLLVLRSADLSRVLSVSPMELPTISKYGPFIRRFDISRDGRWLAVLTGVVGGARPMMAGVQLIDLSDGKVAGGWTIRDDARAIALSEDGSQVLMSRFEELGNRSWDVLLVEATTGRALRGFQSGCPYPDACAASDARFWGKDRIVIVPKPATGSHEEPLATALRVFDLGSGRLVRELDRWQFLSIGSVTMASGAPIALTVNEGLHHSKPELVAFNLQTGTSRKVLAPIPRGQQLRDTEDQYSLRISADSSLVGFFWDKTIRVYRLSPQDLLPK